MKSKEQILEIIGYILRAIVILGIIIFFIYNLIISTDKPTIIALLVFIVFLIPAFTYSVAETIIVIDSSYVDLKLTEKIKDYSEKSMVIIFWICWFGFLTFATFYMKKTYNVEIEMYLLTVPFWLMGIFGIKNTLLKKKDNKKKKS